MASKRVKKALRCCTPVALPSAILEEAAKIAISVNPANAPPQQDLVAPTPQFLAALTGAYWGAAGVDLTVGFMEQTSAELRDRILSHLNAWGEFSNIIYRWTQISPEIRITRAGNEYWSYVGTQNLSIPATAATMSLGGFTMQTAESEYRRVVRHEGGHANGFLHEHQLLEIIKRMNVPAVLKFYRERVGWGEAMTTQQVLTAISAASIMATPRADPDSIMAYHFDGSLMLDGIAVGGGKDFTTIDKAFAAKMYPKPSSPPPPPTRTMKVTLELDPTNGTAKVLSVG